ncbi:SIR2 family NAD-dependent protein deacylase [Rheinheimera faecalis]
MSCIDQLSEEAKFSLLSSVFSKSYFLWIGSGFSYNFGYGSWENVLIKISERIEYPLYLDVKNPLKAAELLCSYAMTHCDYDEYKFNALVAESLLELKEKVDDPEWVRRFRAFAPNNLVTTNWDNLLETVFDGIPNVVVRKDKCPQISATRKNIFKIHGDVGKPESIVVTQTQYFSFQREDTYLSRKIYTLFSEASPIFIGYSLTDPNIGFLYDEVFSDLGKDKPPAYMIIHPSVSDQVYKESQLLFENKNIFIIKAEIGEFLEDLSVEFKAYKKSTKRFFAEHVNIRERLDGLVEKISKKMRISPEDVLEIFNNKYSRHQAVAALVEILSNQILYKDFGKELLTPENRMSYREIDKMIQSVIWMTNEDGYPSYEVKEKLYGAVMKLCAKSDGVWDFYSAEEPFRNILRISPRIESKIFEDRIDHIVDILRWSGPNQLGKCWGTWKVFVDKVDWFNEDDIDEIIHELRDAGRFPYRKADRQWLKVLKTCAKCTRDQKKMIDAIINA